MKPGMGTSNQRWTIRKPTGRSECQAKRKKHKTCLGKDDKQAKDLNLTSAEETRVDQAEALVSEESPCSTGKMGNRGNRLWAGMDSQHLALRMGQPIKGHSGQ